MRRPTVRGVAGATVAMAAVALAVVLPRTLGEAYVDTPPVPAAAARPSTVEAPDPRPGAAAAAPAPAGAAAPRKGDRLRWLRDLNATLAKRMPSLPQHDRLRLAHVIYDEARAASLDPLFVLAVIAVESGFDHVAESERGARGLMQLRPSTLQREAERSELDDEDLEDPVVNVQVGIRYYRRLLRAFGSHDVALMAYNAGPNRILRYLEEDGEIPERFQVYPERVDRELSRLRREHGRKPPVALGDRAPAARAPPGPPGARAEAAEAPER